MPRLTLKSRQSAPRPDPLRRAALAAVEPLERRQLLAGDLSLVQPLPYVLNFDKGRRGVVDVDGMGTGFGSVVPNKTNDEYRQSLIDLRPTPGVLTIRTTGTASAGSNYSTDNTLTNQLAVQFNGTSGAFAVNTVLVGPLDYLNERFEQAGVAFGPNQDNYVKLVAGQSNAGATLQFLAETGSGSSLSFPLGGNGVNVPIGSFGSISSLALWIVGNPSTGKVQAFYKVNSGGIQKVAEELTLTGAQRSTFFNPVSRGSILASHKNNSGGITATFDRFAVTTSLPEAAEPSILAVRPSDAATNVSRDAFVAADVFLPTPGAGVDAATLSVDSVRLVRVSDGQPVAATLNTSGGGDSVVLVPLQPLSANTDYRFEVNANLKDVTGASFRPFNSTFRTGTAISAADPNIAFEQVRLPLAQNRLFSGATMGPDGKLYATTLTGEICRFTIDTRSGEFTDLQVIDTVNVAHGGNRFVTGIAFDPSSTAGNLVAWITHSQYAFENADDWTGGVARLHGANLENYKEMVVGLPRSIRDHLTNQPGFGPDGILYFGQAANSAMGRADATWGLRDEHELSGAILRLNTAAVVERRKAGLGPLNVKTSDGGTYNPDAAGAPLSVHAFGVRNAYDVLFHTDGRTYATGNGSGAGGNTPAGGGAPALTRVNTTQNDYLFNIQRNRYYGHPNPTRDHFVLNGGNPTSGADGQEVPQYPVGTQPDPDYRGPAYDFGKSISPNGLIEYRSAGFGGRLQGKILVTRYSGGDDIIVLTPDSRGRISAAQTGITGLTHFVDPLDLVEDRRTGSLYVVEFGAERITLARPVTPGPNLAVSSSRLLFNDVRGDGVAATETLVLRNVGSQPLTLPSGAFQRSGTSRDLFRVISAPATPVTIPVDGSINVVVGYNARSDTPGTPLTARLNILSNDPDQPRLTVQLRGLATTGTGGTNEPSLQRVLDLHQIPINVGDSNPSSTFLDGPTSPNDEVRVQRFVKAAAGAVTIEPVAMFGVGSNPALRFGFYEPGTGANTTELFTVNGRDAQSVNVDAQGSTMFDPGDGRNFGLYGLFPSFTNSDGSVRVVYQEDALNTWESNANNRRKVRFYPLRTPDGRTVANAYLFAFEEFTRDYDQQDFVGIIRNVKPAAAGPEIGIENLDGAPFFDRLVFNRIQNLDPDFPNAFKSTGKVRIRNSGDQPLVISGVSASSPWAISAGGGGATIAPGGFRDVTLSFNATGGAVFNGTLTISSNDADEPTRRVSLGGFWQSDSESNAAGVSQEPTVAEILQVFGYATAATSPGQNINTGGRIERVGDEVLSSFWVRADGSQPVRVRQLAGFRMQGNTATISWFRQGQSQTSTIFTTAGVDGQSVLPRKNNALTSPAAGQFAPTVGQPFGFKVDNVWSDQSRNDVSRGGEGHYMRFYPAIDANGQFVENTFVLFMDYELILADYQDNVYLIQNISPANLPTPPDGVVGFRSGGRSVIDWADNPEQAVVGYNVYRSLSPTRGYLKRNAVLVSSSGFSETIDFAAGTPIYYRITAVTGDGRESMPSSVIVIA